MSGWRRSRWHRGPAGHRPFHAVHRYIRAPSACMVDTRDHGSGNRARTQHLTASRTFDFWARIPAEQATNPMKHARLCRRIAFRDGNRCSDRKPGSASEHQSLHAERDEPASRTAPPCNTGHEVQPGNKCQNPRKVVNATCPPSGYSHARNTRPGYVTKVLRGVNRFLDDRLYTGEEGAYRARKLTASNTKWQALNTRK
ncbi:hypothetical protein OKW45_008073 [Paraburkholderia sp. WSM4175]